MITSFSASVVSGSGRGKDLGTPTINLDPSSLEAIGKQGIYAVWAMVGKDRIPAVMHAGDRPVFNDTASVEIHLLGPVPADIPAKLTVDVVAYLRAIEKYASVGELQAQIQRDVAMARATLSLDAA